MTKAAAGAAAILAALREAGADALSGELHVPVGTLGAALIIVPPSAGASP